MLTADQLSAAQWARDILSRKPLVLDTETTGLDGTAEICQIAIINASGQTLLDTLVKPSRPIPPSATWIHHIDNDTVKNAERWPSVAGRVTAALFQRPVIIYNAAYELKLFKQSTGYANMAYVVWEEMANFQCAMLNYSAYRGEWNDYRGSYKWQRLTDACYFENIPQPNAPAHSALGDCLRTLALVRKMAESAGEAVPT